MIAIALVLLLQQAPPEDVDWDAEFGVEEPVRDPDTGELPVDSYSQNNSNAGATPFETDRMAEIFGGHDGIRAITDRTIELSIADTRISAIFAGHDMVRLRRTLFEQFCFILGAGCDYTGRDMRASHGGMGVQRKDMNALVENLQQAMRERDVPFAAQNRLLAKLAPMSRDIVER